MEANYFTILWWFLPYIDMDQPGCTCVSPLSEALGENVSLPFSASKAFLHSLVYDTFLFLQNQQCIIFITLSFFHCNIFFFFFLIHSSVQFSCSVVSDSLRPHESQHARSPCPSPTPRVHSNSRPLSQ